VVLLLEGMMPMV